MCTPKKETRDFLLFLLNDLLKQATCSLFLCFSFQSLDGRDPPITRPEHLFVTCRKRSQRLNIQQVRLGAFSLFSLLSVVPWQGYVIKN